MHLTNLRFSFLRLGESSLFLRTFLTNFYGDDRLPSPDCFCDCHSSRMDRYLVQYLKILFRSDSEYWLCLSRIRMMVLPNYHAFSRLHAIAPKLGALR